MNINSLPYQFTTTYRIIRLIKNKPKINFGNLQDIPKEAENHCIKIKEIKICKNEKIKELFKDLEPYSTHIQVFLHGSYADNTQTPFSDIDDFVVMDINGLYNGNQLSKVIKILNKIDMEFCRIDPIQHHGHWICSTQDLQNYNNSFMPLNILNDAQSVIGKNFIEGNINLKISKEGLRRNIINTCASIEKLSTLYFNNNINAYQLKGLVGSFVLMPAFIFQIKGEHCTKPEGIKIAYKIFSESSLSCIQWSTDTRNNWGKLINNKKYKLFSSLSYLWSDPHLWRRIASTFSPKVSEYHKGQLSSIALTHDNVANFINESLEYAK